MNLLREILIFGPPVLFAIVLHEVSHGWVARAVGDPTAYEAGRLTFNPLSHIDLFGSIVLPLLLILSGSGFVFAWAKPVPINPMFFRKPRRDTILVTAAGPVSNLLLAVVLGYVLIGLARLADLPVLRPLLNMLAYGVLINFILAFFNLIPIPPLDGSRILASVFNLRGRIFTYDRYGFIIILALAFVVPMIFGINPLFLWINFFVNKVAYIIFGPHVSDIVKFIYV
jgi:Zn-dependent protease